MQGLAEGVDPGGLHFAADAAIAELRGLSRRCRDGEGGLQVKTACALAMAANATARYRRMRKTVMQRCG